MDSRLKQALSFANRSTTLTDQQKIAKLNFDANLVYAFGGNQFVSDSTLIVYVDMLLNSGKNQAIVLDYKNFPVLIEDLEKFKENIMDNYFFALNEFNVEMVRIKKQRDMLKLLDVTGESIDQ